MRVKSLTSSKRSARHWQKKSAPLQMNEERNANQEPCHGPLEKPADWLSENGETKLRASLTGQRAWENASCLRATQSIASRARTRASNRRIPAPPARSAEPRRRQAERFRARGPVEYARPSRWTPPAAPSRQPRAPRTAGHVRQTGLLPAPPVPRLRTAVPAARGCAIPGARDAQSTPVLRAACRYFAARSRGPRARRLRISLPTTITGA